MALINSWDDDSLQHSDPTRPAQYPAMTNFQSFKFLICLIFIKVDPYNKRTESQFSVLLLLDKEDVEEFLT